MKEETIIYGKFTNSEWKSINGLASVEHVLERIKNEVNWHEYQLWIHGSVLSDVDTYDIDLSILGPLYPHIINGMLETIVRIGFEEGIYCDVKYSVDNHIYDPLNDAPKKILWACYQGSITVNGTTFNYATKLKELYLKETSYPMPKTLRNGVQYKSPVRII